MRLLYSFFLLVFFIFSASVFAETTPTVGIISAGCPITTTLRVGSAGEQVKCLQAQVGAMADGRFGPLTKAAVVSFQLKNGLVGDGIVGPMTRMALLRPQIASGNYPEGCTSAIGYSPLTGVRCNGDPEPSISESQESEIVVSTEKNNPSLKDLETYLAAVKTGALRGGMPESKWPILEEKIRRQDAENPDSIQVFLNEQKEIQENNLSVILKQNKALAFLKAPLSFLNKTFSIKKVLASAGLSFGGKVTYINPEICDCPPGIFTQMYVASPIMSPPLSNMLMDYRNGSQLFLDYNLPEPSVWILGLYTPGVPSCWTYVGEACVLIESYGLILPHVGSSATP